MVHFPGRAVGVGISTCWRLISRREPRTDRHAPVGVFESALGWVARCKGVVRQGDGTDWGRGRVGVGEGRGVSVLSSACSSAR